VGEGAPLSAASLQRLKAQGQLEYDTWKQRRLDARAVGSVWAEGLAGQAVSRPKLVVHKSPI
jgi:hypothetical protein